MFISPAISVVHQVHSGSECGQCARTTQGHCFELKKRLSEYEDSEPRLGSKTSKKSAKQEEEEGDEDLSFAEGVKRAIRRVQELG